MDNLHDAAQLITSIGFPATVAWYVMTRVEATLERLTGQIQRIGTIIEERLPKGGSD